MFYWFMWIKLVAPLILFSKSFTFAFGISNFAFFATSFFTKSSSFKFEQTVFNLTTFKSSTFGFKLFRLVGTLTYLLIPSLSASVFKRIRSCLAAKLDVSLLF